MQKGTLEKNSLTAACRALRYSTWNILNLGRGGTRPYHTPKVDLRLPVDFERLPEFRRLAGLCSHPEALVLWVRLWVELAYLAQSEIRSGAFPEENWALFSDSLPIALKDNAVELLKTAGLLVAENGTGELSCPRFARANKHLAGEARTMQQRGNDMLRFKNREKRASSDAMQQALALDKELFRTPEGAEMDFETGQRVMKLIYCVDGALFKAPRPQHGFTEGLVQDAYRLLKELSAEQIDFGLRKIVLMRGHPGLPQTTEQLLPRFKEIVSAAMKE